MIDVVFKNILFSENGEWVADAYTVQNGVEQFYCVVSMPGNQANPETIESRRQAIVEALNG